MRAIRYRPELDGLRAIAVTAVIANHFDRALLPGGYLGVDVFFVISGYVISSALSAHADKPWREILAGFYVRRMKRLLPALLVCVVTTAMVGAIFVDAASPDFVSFMKSGAYAIVGLSNVYLYGLSVDYFSYDIANNPFLHTWSLGVEEQFYLVYPSIFLVLLAGLRSGRGKLVFGVFAGLAAASLAAFLTFLFVSHAAAYFLMPMRFWELAFGCLVYFATSDAKAASTFGATTWIAAGAMGAGFIVPHGYEGAATMLVVVATGLLIAGLTPASSLYRLLTLPLIIGIGLISYSLYLWHWSVLALARWTVGVNVWTAPWLLVAMLALALISYFCIERPLRYRQWSAVWWRNLAYGAAACVIAVVPIALLKSKAVVLYSGQSPHMEDMQSSSLRLDRWQNGKLIWRASDCILQSNADVGKEIDFDACTLGEASGGRQFLVIGNSFSAAQMEMFDALREARLGRVVLTSTWAASAVREVPNRSVFDQAGNYYLDEVVPSLTRRLRPGDFIVMAFDTTHYSAVDEEGREALRELPRGLRRIAADAAKRGLNVIFENTTPYIVESRCTPSVATPQWFNWSGVEICRYYTKEHSLRRRQPLTEILADVQRNHANFFVLDLLPVFCPGEVCRLRLDDGTYLYRDGYGHPSVAANRLARAELLRLVKEALGATTPRDEFSEATGSIR